jgi:hypothetical protein
VPLFHAQKIALTTGSKTFKIRHNPDATSGSTIQHVVLLAFRADVFDSVQYAENTTDANTTSTSWQNYATLSPTAGSEPRDHVYIAELHKETYASADNYECQGRITFDYSVFMEEQVDLDRRSYDHQIVMGYADTSRGDKNIELQYRSVTGETATALGGYILVLRYPPPNQAPATPTIDNYNTGAWTNDNTPTLQFDMSDPDSGDIIKYQVQVDTGTSYPPDWASLNVDYTESSGSASPRSNVPYTTSTLSNSATSSTYYYWRVRAIDDSDAASDWVAGSFRVDATAPNAGPTVKCSNYTLLQTNQWQNTIPNPSFIWNGTSGSSPGTDILSGINTSNYSYYWGIVVNHAADAGTISTSYTPSENVDSCTTYYLRLIVRDNAGNQYGADPWIYTWWTHKYDATNPSISTTSVVPITNTDYQCADSSTHIWFNSAYSGSFAVHTSQSDQANGSLLRKVTHPSLGTGWTGGGDDISVGAKSSEPDISETYSWTASAVNPGLKTIYVYDGAIYTGTDGNSASCTFTVDNDSTAPSAPAISSVSASSSQITVSASGGSDGQSGLWGSCSASTCHSGALNRYRIKYVQAASYTESGSVLLTDWAAAGNYSTASSLNTNTPYTFRCWVRDNVSNTAYSDITIMTLSANADAVEANSRTTNTWYQGDGFVFTFSSANLNSGAITSYKYIWDTSQRSDVAANGAVWSSGSLNVPTGSFTKTNSKTLYLSVLAYNSNNVPAGQGVQYYGPYRHVETKRLLKHGKFFDDDGVLIEAGPKSP